MLKFYKLLVEINNLIHYNKKRGDNIKVKLIENNKIIDVPHWSYTVIDNKKVILDQEKKVIGIVVEENK